MRLIRTTVATSPLWRGAIRDESANHKRFELRSPLPIGVSTSEMMTASHVERSTLAITRFCNDFAASKTTDVNEKNRIAAQCMHEKLPSQGKK